MPERLSGNIVDFHMGAFDRRKNDEGDEIGDSIAVVYAYDTKGTPRRPAEIIFAPHRAYVDYAEVKEHEIRADDPRIAALGITAVERAYREELPQEHALETVDVGSVERALKQLETVN